MSLRRLGIAATALIAIAGLCGMAAPPALTYNPDHYQNNDPIWDVLNQAEVKVDTKRGEYRVSFPAALIARQGKPLRISGFILPLAASSQSAHFMLVRRNTGCPFCPPNAPTEAVEVRAERPVKYTGEEIAVTGRLALVPSSSEGLFFRLDAAGVSAPKP